ELITYRDVIDNQIHYALQKGTLDGQAPLVRVHLHDTFTDLLRSDRNAERSWTLDKAMQRIGQEGGVLVILGNEESSDLLIHRVKMFEQQDKGQAPTLA
ncbi:bifunctional 3,4-dihydroxy-2-butanone-4-phosphate synthase/GTP cyclohydrolase II, partial [Vibrio anguillarum]|nr:bifunctional 3,4-dihydroxy-2-butanone-4-phosphate synthase/GTP cyclohydrolase II [Vibrio anguillarum]